MTDSALQIHLNFSALSTDYFRRLQHFLDVIRLLETAVDEVTEEQVLEKKQFMSFSPAHGAELQHEEARHRARIWIQTGFLRDSIEATGLFIDECLSTCAVVRISALGRIKGAELNHVLNVLPQRHHKLHFPEKIARLEREFGINSRWVPHVISLNRVRTCLVHRLGKVTVLDVDDTHELVALWRTTKLVARGTTTGKQVLLDRSGILIEEESMVEMNFLDHKRTYAIGEDIKLSSVELYSTIVTLWSFGVSCVEGVETYARSLGIKPDNEKAAV